MSGLTSMRVIRLALIFFLILSPFPGVFAQKGTHVTRRITFQKGSNSTVIRSKARWGTSYIYLLKARAGQVLTVHLEGVPVIRIVPPGARNYESLEGADNVHDWSGTLPRNGNYQLNVGHTNDAYTNAPYTLEIKVE